MMQCLHSVCCLQLQKIMKRENCKYPFFQMLAVLLLASVIGLSAADTPAHCLYEDVRGTWTFYETERLGDASISCDSLGPIVYVKNFTLTFPDTATDEQGNAGTWTLIYNQGFEVGCGAEVLMGFLKQ